MNKENLKPLCHLLGGLVIIVLAFQFFEKEVLNLSILYIIAGCMFLIIAGIHKWLEKKIGKLTVIFFLLEAAAFYYASRNDHDADDSIVNTTLKLLTVMFIFLAVAFLLVREPRSKKHRSKRRRSRSGSSQGSIPPGSSLN